MSYDEKSDKCLIIVGNFTTPLSAIRRVSAQKISKEQKTQNINQLDLIDIYRKPQPIWQNTQPFQVHMAHLPEKTLF